MSQDLKDFEREFWILQANSFEIISRKSENDDIAGGLRARRIPTTVKDRYFSERISSPFDADQLLSSVRGRLDDLYGPCLDDQKFMARVALRKNRGSSFIYRRRLTFSAPTASSGSDRSVKSGSLRRVLTKSDFGGAIGHQF
jgi:hypothetical protein